MIPVEPFTARADAGDGMQAVRVVGVTADPSPSFVAIARDDDGDAVVGLFPYLENVRASAIGLPDGL